MFEKKEERQKRFCRCCEMQTMPSKDRLSRLNKERFQFTLVRELKFQRHKTRVDYGSTIPRPLGLSNGRKTDAECAVPNDLKGVRNHGSG